MKLQAKTMFFSDHRSSETSILADSSSENDSFSSPRSSETLILADSSNENNDFLALAAPKTLILADSSIENDDFRPPAREVRDEIPTVSASEFPT